MKISQSLNLVRDEKGINAIAVVIAVFLVLGIGGGGAIWYTQGNKIKSLSDEKSKLESEKKALGEEISGLKNELDELSRVDTSKWKAFIEKDYSFKYPDAWQYKRGTRAVFDPGKAASLVASFGPDVYSSYNPKNELAMLEVFSSTTIDEIKGALTNPEETDFNTVDGKSTFKKYSDDEFTVFAITSSSSVYVIAAKKDNYYANQANIDALVSSFESK